MSAMPTVNASLNAMAAVLLVAGLVFIKRRNVAAHKACMLGALAVSAIFLACYLVYHFNVGSVKHPGAGVMRAVYLSILISHTILAAAVPFLAGVTLWRAFRGDFARHRAIARWTLPIWLYVSVTGVVVYLMLYVLGGARIPPS
jgi:uncharacterized membrane protein YozB (DUF420 family)